MLGALAKLTSLWANGKLPEDHAVFLCGANLTPLRKPDGGVRPVAVGETLRRLVGKAILATAIAKAQVGGLAPTQVGVGVSGAAEAVAMGTQAIINRLAGDDDWAILKVDMSNAFNSVHRSAVLDGSREHCPALYNFLRFSYHRHVPLYCRARVLSSETGTHQGCPLGPVGFASAIHTAIRSMIVSMECCGTCGT